MYLITDNKHNIFANG